MTDSEELLVFYINKISLCREEFKRNYASIPGIIEVVFDEECMRVLNIKSLEKGNGTILMIYAAKEAMKRGINNIELDDCSDRYNQSNNLYLKLGMEYVNPDCGPEMIGKTDKIFSYPFIIDKSVRCIRFC